MLINYEHQGIQAIEINGYHELDSVTKRPKFEWEFVVFILIYSHMAQR